MKMMISGEGGLAQRAARKHPLILGSGEGTAGKHTNLTPLSGYKLQKKQEVEQSTNEVDFELL